MIEDYESPTLVELGSVGAVTQGQSTGQFLDKTFPAGTNFADLTFSG